MPKYQVSNLKQEFSQTAEILPKMYLEASDCAAVT